MVGLGISEASNSIPVTLNAPCAAKFLGGGVWGADRGGSIGRGNESSMGDAGGAQIGGMERWLYNP